jgi:hypothetical protein
MLRAGEIYFPLLYSVQTGSGAHQPPIQWELGALSPAVKRPERDSDQSPPSNTEIKNGEAILPFPHESSWLNA